jgi:hypothetical protein
MEVTVPQPHQSKIKRPRKRVAERPGSPLAFNVNVRLSREQYGVLLILAEQHEMSIGAATRHVIDQWALGFTDAQGRTLLDAAREVAPDPKLQRWVEQLALQAVPADLVEDED